MAESAVRNGQEEEGRVRHIIRFYEDIARELRRQNQMLLPRHSAGSPSFLLKRSTSEREASLILGAPTPSHLLKKSYYSNGEGEREEYCCSICDEGLDDPEEEQEKKQLGCLHVFHYKCILRWTKRRNTCPLCRRPFDYRSPYYVVA
uniref:TSA: Wollemia nobilis Ref_Wollemi_Transcript_16381_716 transcribed RNA sequence n=1 Tax=Wollemia nobilis TaxID=56998 RepID=A0A0C9QNI6_9CONI